MLEWVIFVGVLFLTGWLLKAYAFTPITGPAPAPGPTPGPATAATTATTATAATTPTQDLRSYRPQSWCLVGENTLGRLCVESTACKGVDRFPSREACEYTEASGLPLGVTEQGGLFYHPFMSREARFNTF